MSLSGLFARHADTILITATAVCQACGPSAFTENLAQICLWNVGPSDTDSGKRHECTQSLLYHLGDIGCLVWHTIHIRWIIVYCAIVVAVLAGRFTLSIGCVKIAGMAEETHGFFEVSTVMVYFAGEQIGYHDWHWRNFADEYRCCVYPRHFPPMTAFWPLWATTPMVPLPCGWYRLVR